MRVDKEIFFAKTDDFEFIPLTQSRGYFDYKSSSWDNVAFYIDDIENPNTGCWGRGVSKFGIKMFYIESLAYKNENIEAITKLLQDIVSEGIYSIIFIVDDNIYTPQAEQAFRQAGFRRPLGQWNTYLTSIVDLTGERRYKDNWRKNISAALKNKELSIERVNEYSDDILDDIAKLSSENAISKHLNHNYSRQELSAMLSDPRFILYTISGKGEIIAARVVFVNKTKAFDAVAANGHNSREYKGATQLLCDKIFDDLKDNGVYEFDFSRLPLGRKGAEGVVHFKSCANGRLTQYNGEWLYARKNRFRYIFYIFYKWIKRKYEY